MGAELSAGVDESGLGKEDGLLPDESVGVKVLESVGDPLDDWRGLVKMEEEESVKDG